MNRKGWIAAASLMVLVTLLTGALFFTASMDAGAEWETNIFEEVISVERTPDHVNERAPMNGEPLHLVIWTLNDQTINAADVSFTWSFEGETSAKGGYQFTRINQTAMEAEIPGYPGGYTINYEIIAYDEKNHPLTSATYSYTVVKNGSFEGDDFLTNIMVEWGPREPSIGEPVTVNITSQNPLVPIERADLFYTVNIPDQEAQNGVDFFERVNSTHMTIEIIPYPAGSRISFYIEAFDSYFDKVRSETFIYEYPRPPVIGPVYTGYIFVSLRDEQKNGPVDSKDTVVQFYNETYFYETSPVNGIAFTNQTVYQGSYKLKVIYKGEEYVFDLNVPKQDGSFSFQFDVNRETFSVPFKEQERPAYLELIGVLMLIAATFGAGYGAVKVKETRERLNEKKKRSRKKTDKVEEDTILEKLIKDEEKKELIMRTAAFVVLSLIGLFFAPFYPWWMVIILAAFISALSWKLPYISMILLSVFVTAAVAYQSKEFGWVFLIFSMVAMIGGFFDWRFGYLSLLTVFLSGFGFGFVVPLAAAVTISLFMGTMVLITSGIFMLIVAPSGNFTWLSFLSSSRHDKSFVTFSRGVNPAWSPVDIVNEVAGLSTVRTDVLSTVLMDTMRSVIPFFGLLGWGAAMVAGYIILRKWERDGVDIRFDTKRWAIRSIPGVIIAIFGIISIIWAGDVFTVWTVLALLGCIPASTLAFTLRALGEEGLPVHYGVEQIKSSDVGKKVSEMVGFRQASFNDIGGLGDVKREVKNALMVPLLEPEMATKYGVKPSKGILLFGPPGCGKTLMLRAVASDLNVDMIGVKCSDVMSKWYGESEGLIASLFEEARARSPCILFLDEIDAIAKRRDFYSTDDVTPRVLSIMLSEMDGMDEAEGIIIVATTNMPDLVDPALMRPGRFDKVIYVPPPDRASRKEILKIHLKGKFVSDDIDLDILASRIKGFSGADIANLVREASSMGLERALETGKPQPITMADLEQVVDEIKPSVTPKMIKMYDKLRREFERKKRSKSPSSREKRKSASDPARNGKKDSASSTPPPPKPPDSGKDGGDVYDLEELEHELDELGEWEES
ncbi:hypothetical protein B6U90_04330 [Thermoplasmatales archaeon ex4484_6]|nr:MAG: hypothetical protein B6U90_04330 [Thermoplasmatales archaeon ex4484_6]